MWQYLNQKQLKNATSTWELPDSSRTIRAIVKDELPARKAATKEIINWNMKSTNEQLDKLYAEIAELTKSLERTQDQFYDELKIIKTEIRHCSQRIWTKNWRIPRHK